MRNYYESLDWQGKKRYKEKLDTVGLSLEDDRYGLDERLTSDMTSWPNIEYGHIFTYFITRPSPTSSPDLRLLHHQTFAYFITRPGTYFITRPSPTSSPDLRLLHHQTFAYFITRPSPTSSPDLRLLHHQTFAYFITRPSPTSSPDPAPTPSKSSFPGSRWRPTIILSQAM